MEDYQILFQNQALTAAYAAILLRQTIFSIQEWEKQKLIAGGGRAYINQASRPCRRLNETGLLGTIEGVAYVGGGR